MKKLSKINIERLNDGKKKSNCLIACLLLGWQGGTIHQVSRETGLSVIEILESKDIVQLIKGIMKRKKLYYRQDNIGKAKYTINYYDGVQKHKDGSDFYSIRIFKNKKELLKFEKNLKTKGYKERGIVL